MGTWLSEQISYEVVYEVPRPVRAKFQPSNASPLPPAELRWKMLRYGYFDRLSYVYQTLENAVAATPFVSGNEINYPQIFHGVTVRFTCASGRMKEEIVFSQTARDSLRNPSLYGLSPSNTFLMFAAEIDLWPGNIKAVAQTPTGKVPIKNGNRFAFNGIDPIDFEDAQENVYFSLPSDYAWAANDSTDENVVPVFRVFYTQQGRHYLLLGVPWTWVNAAPKGPLVIDPTVTIDNSNNAFRDTRLQTATNFGTDFTLMVGKKSDSVKKRTIIKVDFASSGIPSNATILISQLQLYYYDAQRAGGDAWQDRWVQAHQVLKSWAETQATRDERLTGTAWAAQYAALDGTDASSTMESTMLFQSGETGTWKSWNLTALTQKWINGTAANNGVILWATNEDTEAHDLRFYSRENATNQPKLVVTWSNTPKTVYFLKDHLGSTRATVDQTGIVVGYDDYDPWGYVLGGRTMATPWSASQSVAENKFTGKERDDDFGINWDYFGARYYDAEIGRWMARDPLADKYPSLSPYNYSANNPVVNVDRDGRWIDTVVDVAFIVYDVYDIAKTALSGQQVSATQYAALGADVAGALIPFATGGGAIVRGANKADEVVETLRAADQTVGTAKTIEQSSDATNVKLLTEKAGPVGQIAPSDVSGKTPSQIDAQAKQIGLEPKGPEPSSGKGAYVDPQTGQQRILVHPNDPAGPHGHVNNPQGQRIGPDGTVVNPKSNEAHLPIKKEEKLQ